MKSWIFANAINNHISNEAKLLAFLW